MESRINQYRALVGLLLLSFLFLFPLQGAAGADAEAVEEGSRAETEVAESDHSGEDSVHPVWREIQELIAAQEVKLAELNATLENTDDVHETIRLQREIEEIKMATEIEFFRVQIRHAEKIGNTEAAERMQQTVDSILTRLETENARRAETETTQR